MGRPSKREAVTESVRAYLALAETRSPDEYPLDVSSIAMAVGCARASIFNYGLQTEILLAAERQREHQQLPMNGGLKGQLRQLRAEIAIMQQRNLALLERLNLVEANAARLNIDPEELYRPLPLPPRQVSQAGRKRLVR
jgi:hypothetical protein